MSWWDEFFSVFSRNNIKFEANRISALQNGSKKQCHLQLAPFPKLAYDNKARSVELEVVQMYARNLLGPVTIWALVCWHNIHTRTHTHSNIEGQMRCRVTGGCLRAPPRYTPAAENTDAANYPRPHPPHPSRRLGEFLSAGRKNSFFLPLFLSIWRK